MDLQINPLSQTLNTIYSLFVPRIPTSPKTPKNLIKKMHQRSSISLSKFILRHPFHHSPKPISPIFSKLFSAHTNSSPKPPFPLIPTSKFQSFHHPIHHTRSYATEFDKNKIIDEINMKFGEAREEIEAAMDSKETVYFNEEAECAKNAVNEVLDMFNGLLGRLDGQEKEGLLRSMGLKMEQLKAELKQLDE